MLLIRYVRDRKGIRGCLAVHTDSGDVAYSLCNKLDRHKSTKKLARQIAVDRLAAGKTAGHVDFRSGYFVKRVDGKIIPSKIHRLIKRTLKRMPLAKEFEASLSKAFGQKEGQQIQVQSKD